MSRWVFDLGNTRLKCALLQADGSPGPVTALAHDDEGFFDALDAVLPVRATHATSIAYVASVASPALTARVLDALTRRFSCISIARTTASFAGVRIAYAEPGRLGVDRFLAMLGARARASRPWLVVGVGTAITLDLLDAQGVHVGGRIAPSPRTMRDALQRAAVQLPADGGVFREFARDTADALASGCDGAAAGLVERSLRHAEAELGAMPGLLLHGGGAETLRSLLPHSELAPSLVLEGLAHWAAVDIRA